MSTGAIIATVIVVVIVVGYLFLRMVANAYKY